jgi:hypothetical protein
MAVQAVQLNMGAHRFIKQFHYRLFAFNCHSESCPEEATKPAMFKARPPSYKGSWMTAMNQAEVLILP